jgi:hypothetical protein
MFPEITAKIQAVEAKLSQLDPVLHRFCTKHNYTLSIHVGVWPRRKLWLREEIDRTLDLTMDLSVSEVMQRGFYPEMPWSLYATGSLPQIEGGTPFLTITIFHGLPFSTMAHQLEARLEDGFEILQGLKTNDIVARGKIHGRIRRTES